ncbi:MAG: hypothetical protein HYV40_01485 [Candidatus Levybacteria bacterium]|nr:hypothetical protein [Candidatus Levybacteria bacterium]
MHIVPKKDEVIEDILSTYKNVTLFLIDDRLEVLFKAKQVRPDTYTIWMKRGPFAEKTKQIEGFLPDATVDDLRMVLPIVTLV